jgi:hypothetical protein
MIYTEQLATYFDKLEVPDDFRDMDHLVEWYFASGTPLAIPWDADVVVSDDATAISLFRHKHYQVELYLVYPSIAIPLHEHPGMLSRIISLGGGKQGRAKGLVSTSWGVDSGTTSLGQKHGGRNFGSSPRGYAMLTFQIWPVGMRPTSAAYHWKGETAGPKQDALIKAVNPSAISIPGYADVTQVAPEGVL